MRLRFNALPLVAAGAATVASATAQTVISDNFEVDTSADYTVVDNGTGDGTSVFAFDYVAAGIPLAPRSNAGDTGGLRLTANDSLIATYGRTCFHNTAVNAPMYKLTVDVYHSFTGTAGTTEHAHVGVGGDGATYNQLFTPISGTGAFLAFDGDGGSGSDYRWFRSSLNTPPGDMSSTTLPNSHPSYLGHGSNNSDPFFQALYPAPPSTIAGSPGNIWVTVEIVVDNVKGVISFLMDGTLVYQGEFAGDFNGLASLGIADPFTSVDPGTVSILYDNLEVEVLPTNLAQTAIFGLNVRLGNFFTTEVGSYVSNYKALGPWSSATNPVFALDFDPTGQTLYVVNNTTLEVGTLDLTSGALTLSGTLVTGLNSATAGVSGLTCTPNGTWYVSQNDAASGGSSLYVGDITTGVFTFVGLIDAGIIIDISADASGALYGHSISTDDFWSIDTVTGAGTSIVPTGLAGNFAQGGDFNWSDGLYYAPVYTGGGTGMLVTFDPATGTIAVVEDTVSLNAEMEIACRVPVSIVNFDVCGPGVLNSTGMSARLQVAGCSRVTDNEMMLTVHNLPLNSSGIFVNSPGPANITVFNPGGSLGNLCIANFNMGRHNVILNSATSGAVQLVLDLTMIPQPNGFVSVLAGETWSWQYWYRDVGATSNWSNARTVQFL